MNTPLAPTNMLTKTLLSAPIDSRQHAHQTSSTFMRPTPLSHSQPSGHAPDLASLPQSPCPHWDHETPFKEAPPVSEALHCPPPPVHPAQRFPSRQTLGLEPHRHQPPRLRGGSTEGELPSFPRRRDSAGVPQLSRPGPTPSAPQGLP